MGGYTGSVTSLSVLGCTTAALFDEGATVDVTVEAGQRLFLLTGSTVQEGSVTGVEVSARYLTAAPTVETTVGAHAKVTKDGVASVSGTVQCDPLSTAYVDVQLVQTRGGATATGTAKTFEAFCGPTPTRWSVEVTSETAAGFKAGRATLHVTATGICEQGETTVAVLAPVKLRRTK